MELHELSPAVGSKRARNRVGRGHGSGNGKTSGRGHKGQKSRSGYSRKPGFEGGQLPMKMRIPKRGFTNIFAKPPTAVNLALLERFKDGDVVDAAILIENGLIPHAKFGVKVLGEGNFTKKLTVQAKAFSASAKEKIEAAGGKAEVIAK
ncbi:MAG: 50S ribosomal protein L15 [Oscillospiraceae bacterium]|nr:50S ribosomal protein L15 [Oscillospiraceae bacterium]